MISYSFTRRLTTCFGATFFAVLAWKFILLLLTAQPIPANDAYGYDGAVVNFLVNGHYANPSLRIPFPFSGEHIYCIYPPLYQGVLCLWMLGCGTSALSAMWFHFVLFALYALVLRALLRRLQTPGWAANVAGLFLFGITFNDRPDALAQVLGMVAVYAWVRGANASKGFSWLWPWVSTVTVVLACCTNPEIGGLYLGLVWLLSLGSRIWGMRAFPAGPVAVMTLAPIALVALVKYGRPDLWGGFMEHAGQTPSFTGWRRPTAVELLKLIRTVPAVLFIAGFFLWRRRGGEWRLGKTEGTAMERCLSVILIALLLLCAGFIGGTLCLFTADWILILGYFQPLLVAVFLTFECRQKSSRARALVPVFAALILLVSIRAVGMSTWGVACAVGNSYGSAMQSVRAELDRMPTNATVVMSSAFLYEAARHPGLQLIHEDWTHRADEKAGPLNGDTAALIRLKPAALILTQFDYYRRFQFPRKSGRVAPLEELKGLPEVVSYSVTNLARVRAPDSFPKFQQVLQHVSWAPVIVEFNWK